MTGGQWGSWLDIVAAEEGGIARSMIRLRTIGLEARRHTLRH